MIKQLAMLSTLLILFALFGFAYVVLEATGLDRWTSAFASFLVCLLWMPATWRFALREARLQNGDRNAERKD
jgi:uncharacterized BrkB/YihY/UPF0761 family membrane protein